MRVKCVLCDTINHIDDHAFLAKRLRNRPIHTYMCQPCHDRITVRTMERQEKEAILEEEMIVNEEREI